jgi:hypothetical protein
MRRVAIVAVLIAAVTSVLTWWPWGTGGRGPAQEEDRLLTATGDQVDPEEIASLRVATWSDVDNAPEVFEVARKGSDWVIPSHFDYPADAVTRVGDTAGAVLNVPRGPLVTSDIQQHAELGVIDPLQEGAADAEGRGKRVTLTDQGGAPLVDIIIGDRTEHADVYYVREAGEDAVHTADVNPDIRTSFSDWVKTDLLDISRGDLRTITVLDQSIDEVRGVLVTRSNTTFAKDEDATEWRSENMPPGRKVNQDTLGDLVDELTMLRLVGVRPYSNMWLEARGFYLLRDGSLVGNEGSIQVRTKDGLVHHLFFGEIALGDEADTSAEIDPGSLAPDEAESHNRYMAAFVQYVPEFDEARLGPSEAAQEEGGEETEAEAASGEAEGSEEVDNRGKAAKKQQRFGRFFYVISDESFTKLRPPVEELFERR